MQNLPIKNNYIRMKKLIILLLSALLIAGCASSKKYLERAQYDAAINMAVKKLRKNPSNIKELDVLKQAFPKANQVDKDRIDFLKTSGDDNVWDQIFNRYANLKDRQQLVKTLPDNVLNSIGFIEKNYDRELLDAKKKAAEYFYTHAIDLLKRKDRNSARDAFYELKRVKQLYSDYKDVDARLQEAQFLGTNNVLFKMLNNTKMIIPQGFEEELLKISLKELNGQWLNYDTKSNSALYYDYTIYLNLNNIFVSPEQVNEESHTEEREIEDGFKYKLDSKGNVMRDTAGNDIKIPVIKIITCKVIQVHQMKRAMISGTLDYFDNRTKQLIKTDPISAEWVFENHSANAFGDLNALKPETKKLLGNKPLPFPSNPDMIMQANQILKQMSKDIIWCNKGMIQ